MKLACNIAVGNRMLPALAIQPKARHVRSTLALCKIPKSEEFCLILFSGLDKNGKKYNLKGNINQVLTKFINNGKATIQLKMPPHDLYIQADVIQLKSFLHLLKRAWEGKIAPNERTYSTMSVTPVVARDLPPTKLMIRSRSDYPTKGFPRTLEILHINDIKRGGLDRGILQLVRLKVLDLSVNWIESLPEELNRLPNLSELNLASNRLFKSSPKQWDWLGGNLSKTLVLLNLDSNNLVYLPDQIAKLHKLVTFNVNNNLLTVLPAGIGNLRNLKILSVSDNKLTELPGSVRKLRLQSLDVSNNSFERNVHINPPVDSTKHWKVCSLKEYSGRKVLGLCLPYTPATIPWTVVRYLDHAKYCVCGAACFEMFIRASESLLLMTIAQTVNTSGSGYAPIDSYFCSMSCYQMSHIHRNRYPVIRE